MGRVETLVGMAILVAATAAADTIVTGKVRNPITGSGVAGVDLSIEHQGQTLTSGRSSQGGRFELSFAFPATPEAHNVTLTAELDGFSSVSRILIITGGRPDSTFYDIAMLPSEISNCRVEQSHLVIVGHFLPPVSTSAVAGDLADRVRQALEMNLVPAIQREGVPFELLPLVFACGDVKPESTRLLPRYAQTLDADVFVSGNVKTVDGAYDVTTNLGDRYAVLDPFRPYKNSGVELDDPTAAELEDDTYAAILLALAKGYEQASRFAECVEITVAAERMLEQLTPELTLVREACQQQSGVTDLLEGGPS